MKLSISNIGWSKEHDEYMYKFLKKNNFSGIEIAPTRIFPNKPYDNLEDAKIFSSNLKTNYNLEISSIQSIWFNKTENIFKSEAERNYLLEYTKKTIDFSNSINCKNIVFGCPKNRNCDDNFKLSYALDFFSFLGNYAFENNTVLSIEPNPLIYNTNFINTTEEAFNFVKKVNCKGLMVNVDFGTIIENSENLNIVEENISLVNHIHISEPFLEKVKERVLHYKLKEILIKYNYDKFISIEMKNLNNINDLESVIKYVKGVFE